MADARSYVSESHYRQVLQGPEVTQETRYLKNIRLSFSFRLDDDN